MGAAARPATTAHRADGRAGPWQQETGCGGLLKRTCSCVCAATAGFLLLVAVCLLYLPDPLTLDPPHTAGRSDVTLLVWTHPFGRYHRLPDCFELYQIAGCTLTDEKSAYPQADAVIIHHREVASGDADLPPEPRPRAQKWIWMNYESPTHTPSLWRFENVFNLTMTYRRDSDIFIPYGYLVPRERGTKGVQNRFAPPLRASSRSHLRRPRLLAWVISNWLESHVRVSLYYKLRSYLQVDVFGRSARPVPEDSGGSSVVRLVGRYQFYLALENSQHTDYITEKLWNAVRAGAVPVVLGPSRKNYERFLPPEAFIHVDDFPTVRGLARYLLMLRGNPEMLRRHLDWRGRYTLHQPVFWADHYCKACGAVSRNRGKTEVVQHLARWFQS
ncbi:alpha-(1,3)-fucosyltransferase 4-like [Clinocottus analis]|uniref:alpha-(1,3)-fucosyltransferase 4-like n=1 Tax=Clinocottus analis TaxID=304258 RepID=UPI0035C23BC3